MWNFKESHPKLDNLHRYGKIRLNLSQNAYQFSDINLTIVFLDNEIIPKTYVCNKNYCFILHQMPFMSVIYVQNHCAYKNCGSFIYWKWFWSNFNVAPCRKVWKKAVIAQFLEFRIYSFGRLCVLNHDSKKAGVGKGSFPWHL